ncbi:MAG TPA: hypothetical protein VJ865_01260 [Gemmatimonadaceae bacterium]|nr:hypothetical protein [Gemmatimonadaceae bacterium]
MRDDSALHQIDEQRGEARFDDVAAEHHDNCPFVSRSSGDRIDDAQEIARNEYVGKRFKKCGEAAILSWRRREFTGGDFIWSSLDGDCLDLGEIDLLGRASRAARPALTA